MSPALRDEIKQSKPFPRRSAEALLSVMRTAAVLEHALNDVLRPHGLTITQYNVLRILRGAGDAGLCGRQVGERLIAKVPDVSRLLERMEDTGIVQRERSEDDRRHVTARITEAGRRMLDVVTPELEAVERARFGRLNEATLQALIAGLALVREPR
jgi:DNA-binding MarR family transcriptional regulator